MIQRKGGGRKVETKGDRYGKVRKGNQLEEKKKVKKCKKETTIILCF